MKRVILLIISLVLIICLSACGSENSDSTQNEQPNTEQSNSVSDSNPTESEPIMESEWGVQETIVAENGDDIITAYIKFPSLTGIIRGTGKIAYQSDKTLVILDAQRMTGSPEVQAGSVNILPAYFEQTEKIMERYRRADYSDFSFSIDSQETVDVNDYEMVRYEGTHTCLVNGESTSLNYVAFATRLKGNDACIYWMVLDESDDQSLSALVSEYAEKMANSLHE